MSETKKPTLNEAEKPETETPLLDFLAAHREKLELLLSGEQKASPLLHKISGKRKTRTIFLAEKLQFIMNEYCIQHEIQIADFCETAIVQYLNSQGYTDELKDILSLAGEKQEEPKE